MATPDQSVRRDDSTDDIEICTWLFEQYMIRSNLPRDRSWIRRAVIEASNACGGFNEATWWTCLQEAGQSLGLKTKLIDANWNQVLEMGREGATVCLRTDNAATPWIALNGVKGAKLGVLLPFHQPPLVWFRARRLRNLVGAKLTSDILRCVVLEPDPAMAIGHDASHDRSPLWRLHSLLRPEWPDIRLVLIFAVVIGLLMLATPIAVEALVNTVAFGRFLQPIVVLATILFAFLGFQAAIRTLQTWVVEVIQRRMFARVSADLAFRLPRARTESFDDGYAPELVNRFFDVVTLQKVSAQLLLDGVQLILSALIGMAVLAFYHPWLLGFDVMLLVSIAVIIFGLGRGAIGTSIIESKKKYKMAAWFEDLSRCPTAFKADGGAEFALERVDRLTDDYLRARQSHFRILIRQILFSLMLQAVASTVLLGLGGWLVISGQLTLGQLVASELILTIIVGSFAKLGKHMEAFYDLMASIDKLGQLFDLPTERTDGLLSFGGIGPAALVLHHITYNFAGKRPVLDNVSCELQPGDRLAVVGEPGSGKSTLLELIYGLRVPSLGHLTIDDCDPRDVRPDVARRAVAFVGALETFEGSIAENIHLERPHVSTNDVRYVLDILGLTEAIQNLPNGLETRITSGGRPLSDQQCRMLMLARAIVGRPRLLLIDGTLDVFSDDYLQSVWPAVGSSDCPWTLVVVTGRQQIIDWCNRHLELKLAMTRTSIRR